MNWISIKKKKPSEGSRVLICDDAGYITVDEVRPTHNIYAGKMTWLQAWKFGNGTRITHWMPLPTPPEGSAPQ